MDRLRKKAVDRKLKAKIGQRRVRFAVYLTKYGCDETLNIGNNEKKVIRMKEYFKTNFWIGNGRLKVSINNYKV